MAIFHFNQTGGKLLFGWLKLVRKSQLKGNFG